MIYGYIRVSSDKQTVENQRFEITKFCEAQNLVINDWIEETISGAKITVNDNLADCLGKCVRMILSFVVNYPDLVEISL